MNFDTNELICALSSDRHFVDEPIVLSSCGHTACRNCLPECDAVCKTCGTMTERDLRNDMVSKGLQQLIKVCLDKLFPQIEAETRANLRVLKNLAFERSEWIDLHLKFTEEEIEIRIESLKAELDEIQKSMLDFLDSVRNDLKSKYVDTVSTGYYNIDYFEKRLKELEIDMETPSSKNETNFYAYQADLIIQKQIINDSWKFKLKFTPSSVNISALTAVGEIEYNNAPATI